LHSKGNNQQGEEKTSRVRENICKLFMQPRIKIQNRKETKKHNNNNKPIKNVGIITIEFLKRR
jgi:hypothetical protein